MSKFSLLDATWTKLSCLATPNKNQHHKLKVDKSVCCSLIYVPIKSFSLPTIWIFIQSRMFVIFFPALSKHFDSFSHPIFHSIFFFRSIRIVSVCAHFLSCFFAFKQHLNRLLRFKYLFIQTIFLFWPAIQAGVWLCRFFSLPSEKLATLHVDDDDSIVAFALSQTL